MITATYSPEDNKIRLYPSARLDADTYARVRAAGFKWAPKQDLFVAPMWTPEREDLAIELAGEIDDEDKSLVERQEERAERFEGYSDNRERDAAAAADAVHRIADGIPLGQPILVGHHSERHARRDQERIENGMRRAVKMWRQSEYWTRRAEGAIRLAKYKELPSVRARRIKGLEAEERKQQKYIAHAERFIKHWSTPDPDRADCQILTKERATKIANYDGGYFARNHLRPSGYDGPISLWEALRDDVATVEAVRDKAIENHRDTIARCSRWLEHYRNRLAYERAMLGTSEGERAAICRGETKPEKGGAVVCWVARGRWSYVVKVNKVTVSVLDNWGNGGANFTRTIEFDKLQKVMSRADVDAAREAGRLIETADKTGFYLTDTPPPSPKPEPEPAPALAGTIEAMRATLDAGPVAVVVVPQLFPTPSELAARLVELAGIRPGDRILEPSAGTGRILNALPTTCGAIVAVEIHAGLIKTLRASYRPEFVRIEHADFLEWDPGAQFDRIIMNPPFTKGSDIRHIQHARSMLAPGGRLVSVCAAGPRQREAFADCEWIDLPAGTFEDAGTNVSTAIVIIDAPEAAKLATIAEVAEEFAQAERTAAPLADVPFSLTSQAARGGSVQGGLF